MRFLLLSLAIAYQAFAVDCRATCQETKQEPERQRFLYPFPNSSFKGRFELAASSAQRVQVQSSTGTVLQLRGDVEVVAVVCGQPTNDPCVKSPLILHADAIDYNEKTGEISAAGNVHTVLTQPPPNVKYRASPQIDAHGYLSDCDQKKTLPDYSNDLKSTPHSSLVTYCTAELLLQKRNYQASVNAYRDSLAGDGSPVWTKVWSHIQIGKVFDVTRQRERAVREYQLAIQTGDDTDGAISQARELLEHPFEWPANQ
jgi:hypothetical protein